MVSLAPFHPVFQRESEFRLHVLGNIADPFVLLRSRDLKTWTPISTNAPVAGWEVLSDSTAESADAYFYRVADEQSLNAVR